MKGPKSVRAGRGRGHGAFTLVELVTAASLMTVMMIGVVQVFGIITQTASEAEGVHFAQQQGRAFFDRLHNDLRGMTREGYLKISHQALQRCDTTVPYDDPYAVAPVAPQLLTEDLRPMDYNALTGTEMYACDTLAFVAVGPCVSTFASPAIEGGAAEVVYTSNVKTPTDPLRIQVGDQPHYLDPRRGILGRGQWMLVGGSGGNAGDLDDRSAVPYLSDLYADQNPPRVAQGTPPSHTYQDRISREGGQLVVWPWFSLTAGIAENPRSLKRVMACCVSEFYVETFDPEGRTSILNPLNQPGEPGEIPNTTRPLYYFWANPKEYVASTYFTDTDRPKTWPRAIRVTVAIHDPGDTSPRPANGRFRGYAMQETFWLTDP